MFLTVDDYRSVCDDYEFEQITENDDTRAVAEAAVARFGMSVQPALKHRAVPHVSVHTPEFAISLCIADVI